MDETRLRDLITQLATEAGLVVVPAPVIENPPQDPPVQPPSSTVRVVHWNLHHGGIPVDANEVDHKLNVQAVTDWLIQMKPDIVSLNELEEFDGYGQLDQLEHHRAALQEAQKVPWYAEFVAASGSGKRQGGGNGLLSKSPLGNPMRKSLSASRSIIAAQQPQIGMGTGYPIVATTHLSSTSAADRGTQVKEVVAFMQGLPAAERVILAGDFNAVPTASELGPLGAAGYKDAWMEASKVGMATSIVKPNGITHGSHRIDYVWVKGWVVVSVEVPDTSVEGLFPSDHHPVVVVLA